MYNTFRLHNTFVCVYLCAPRARACVCVWRERERETDRQTDRQRQRVHHVVFDVSVAYVWHRRSCYLLLFKRLMTTVAVDAFESWYSNKRMSVDFIGFSIDFNDLFLSSAHIEYMQIKLFLTNNFVHLYSTLSHISYSSPKYITLSNKTISKDMQYFHCLF